MSKQTALITGATGGLGKEFARIHAETGGDLVLVGRNPQKLEQLQHDVQNKYHVQVTTITVDFTEFDAAEQIFGELQKANIQVDYLINNAGLGGQGTFLERTMEEDINMAKFNMIVPTKLMKLILPQMVKRGSGRVLNVSSLAALVSGPLQAEYYATKAYLTSLSDALWHELRDTGVTLTTLMPGAMETGFAKAGGLTNTKMFANAVSPKKVAEEGYQAMLNGKMNVYTGLRGWQRPFVSMMPMMPKKAMMRFIADQHSKQK